MTTFNQDNEKVRELANQQGGLISYLPASAAPFKLNTLIPTGMAFEAQRALNQVVKKRKDIDGYVAKELKYPSKEDLWNGFGASKSSGLASEQVDSLALYLIQFERDQGLIIADQTGIGKGRQAAAVIRHAIVNGYLPIFFTRKEDLFTDIYRDLLNIGHTKISPFILNTTNNAKVKDSEGNVLFSPLSRDAQMEYINRTREVLTDSEESIAYHKKHHLTLPDLDNHPKVTISDPLDHLPADYDLILATYSQIQSAHESKKIWLKNIIKNGVEGSKKYKKVVLILDECHMAGGYNTRIGNWFREVLPDSKSACFLSATFAKYPEVMPLYMSKTALKETQMDDFALVHAMSSGGLALQEIVASLLVQSGQLIRRQRSRQGIEVNYLTIDQEPERSKIRERVDIIISLMNDIVEFEQTYVIPFHKRLQAEAKKLGESVEDRPRNLGVKSSPFFSRVFNIVDQMLFSLKVEAVAKKTIELLNKDKKVVIAFKSTMGSFLEESQLTAGDSVTPRDLDFAKTLVRSLDSTLRYSYTHIDGKKEPLKVSLDELPVGARVMYDQIKLDITSVSSGLHTSPIDQLISIIENTKKKDKLGGHNREFFTVEEVTGRNKRVVIEDRGGIIENFKPQPEKSFRRFNSGQADVLLINQSGSTGFSAHASEDFKDQRQRHMISHQFELDINIEVQKWGRIDRTGQVVLPAYHYIITDVPIERRLMNMLKSKLKKLDANTTGSQKTNDGSLESPDFFNVIGDKIAFEYITENPNMAERLYYPTYHKDWDGELERNASSDGAMRQVTGRSGLLPVNEQDKIFDELAQKYAQEVEYQKQNGTYDLETEFMPLDAKVLERFLYQKGKGGFSPFGKDAIREINEVKNLKKPYTRDELDQRIEKILNGQTPEESLNAFKEEIEANFPKLIEERNKKRYQELRDLHQRLEDYDLPSPDEEEVYRKAEIELNRLSEEVATKEASLEKIESDLNFVKKNILNIIDYWKVGDPIKVSSFWDKEGTLGVYLGISINRSAKNPYTLGNISLRFAVSDARKQLEYQIGGEKRKDILAIKEASASLTDDEKNTVRFGWDELTRDMVRPKKKSTILTGNILLVSNEINQGKKLIKYNRMDGTLVNGILLSDKIAESMNDTKATYPINLMLPYLEGLQQHGITSDSGNQVVFQKQSDHLFEVSIKKQKNEKIYTDKQLRELLEKPVGTDPNQLADFVQSGGDMTGVVNAKRMSLFLDRLADFSLTFLGEATKVKESDLEEDYELQLNVKGIFTYVLSRELSNTSHPLENFKSYQKPNKDFGFGTVTFDRKVPLEDREKFGLVPRFKNIEVPVQEWKRFIQKSDQNKAFETQLEFSKKLPIFKAFKNLGQWMLDNPHEEGAYKYVFGDFTAKQLGRAIYSDMIKDIVPIDIYREQLLMALKVA